MGVEHVSESKKKKVCKLLQMSDAMLDLFITIGEFSLDPISQDKSFMLNTFFDVKHIPKQPELNEFKLNWIKLDDNAA